MSSYQQKELQLKETFDDNKESKKILYDELDLKEIFDYNKESKKIFYDEWDLKEPMLQPGEKRLTVSPIQHPDIFEKYEIAEGCFWPPSEIDLSNDTEDWKKLSSDEQEFLSKILAFFAASDGLVLENLNMNLCSRPQYLEIRMFFDFQAAMENIHSVVYSRLIETYIIDPIQRSNLLNGVKTNAYIGRKADWCRRYMHNVSFRKNLVAFAIVEGVFFCGSFCSIFWIGETKTLKGLTQSNGLISRDETLHFEFAAFLYRKLEHQMTDDEVYELMQEAVKLEVEFITDAVPCTLVGINATLMKQYVEYVADRLLLLLGHPKLYTVENPFPFMNKIGAYTKSNFFEKKGVNYNRRGNVGQIITDADF